MKTLILGKNLKLCLIYTLCMSQIKTGRLVLEMALKFIVQDPTDSNAGDAQAATESKLLKIV